MKKTWNRSRQKSIWGVLFVLPCFLIIFLFVIYPLFYTGYLSLSDYNFIYDRAPKFTGFSNYAKMFLDSDFVHAMKTTLFFAVLDFSLLMVISLAIALLLFFCKRGTWLFRTAVFMPIVVPASLACIVFSWIFSENFGLLNYFLGTALHLPALARPWLTQPGSAMSSILVVNLWCNIGFETILFLSGLQSISGDVLEAADMDGAVGWKKLVYVILPNLKETYVVAGIWAIIAALKVFVEPMVMTNGGPGNATLVLYMYIYNNAFLYFNMGYASAIAFVLSGMILFFSLLNMKLNSEEAER